MPNTEEGLRVDAGQATVPASQRTGRTEQNGIGEQLAGLRGARGLSLRELARRAGVAQSSLTRWEQGRFAPRLPELTVVLDALAASAEERTAALRHLDRPRAHAKLAREEAHSAGGTHWIDLEWPAPSCGSLLKAIRLRSGKTLEDAARVIGAQAGTLSRWERGLAWPSPDTIQAIGAALGASPEEQAALARGRRSLNGLGTAGSLEGLDHHFRVVLEPLEMVGELNPGRDMHFLQMEAALWPLARQSTAALTLLAEVYAHYGNYLSNLSRWSEAKTYLSRALDMMPGGAHPTFLVMAAIRSTEMGAWNGGRFRPAQSIAMLDAWYKYAVGTRYQEFMTRKKATYLALEGRFEHALDCCRSMLAHAPLVDEAPHVRLELQRSQAWVLIHAGRFQQALHHIPEPGPFHASHALRDALYRAQAYLGLNRPCEAHEWIGQALALAETLNLPHRRTEAMELACRL